MSRAPWSYRAVLRLYPRAFRERSARELEAIAARMAEDRGGWVVLSLAVDGLRALPGAWLREMHTPLPARGPGGRNRMASFWSEWRHAARRLRRSPGYTVAAAVTLALGIGATTAIWAVVDAALLRPLPYADAGALVALSSTRRGEEISVAWLDLQDWRQRTRTLEGPAGFVSVSYNVTGEGAAARLRAQAVTSDLFGILGVAPLLGRAFTPEEDRPGAAPVAILSWGLWQTRYGGDPAILDRTLLLDGVPFSVVGVMPEGFVFPDGIVFGPAELWVGTGAAAQPAWQDRQSHTGFIALGRLRPGATVDAARAELEGIAAALAAEHPDTNGEEGVIVRPALEVIVGDLRRSLYVLLGAVGVLLLIACANVANLALVRAVANRRDVVVRATLGAGRGRIALSVLCESVLLGLLGGALGILFARAGVAAAGSMIEELPRLGDLTLDGRVLAFAALVSFATALVFGLVPALINASDAAGRLRPGMAGTRIASGRIRGAFVVTQVALALVLLIGAGVLVRSFAAMRNDRGGIRAEGVITFTLRLPQSRYDGAPANRFYEELAADIAALPGVRSVGGISVLPFSGAGSQSGIAPAGGTRDDEVRTDVNGVTPGYFETMGIELLRGRTFRPSDREGSGTVVVVDERFANRFWPGEDPIGKRVQGWGLADAEVVGVVGHVKNYGVTAESRQELYMPHAQRPYLRMSMVVRTDDPAATFAPIREIVQRLDPDLPVDGITSMTDIVSGTIATPRLAAFLSATFAVLATVMAAVGLYGVIAYGVNLRVQEIGTRMALGARPGQVVRLVVSGALVLATIGVAIGVPASWALTRVLEGLVFGVSPRDPVAFLGLSGLLLAVAAVAGALPAVRAARISPRDALREG